MCGICGFNWRDDGLLKSMCESLTHRGPDDSGTRASDGVSLGHRRLSIIDLSERGRQPMCNEDGSLWIIYNGEIYNYIELRQELEGLGHHFKSDTDTEVVIHAYEEWGSRCLNRFNGMWAFCIHDTAENQLFMSRDRFGIKPLYYYLKDGKFIFASEIKALLKHDLERKPNDDIVFDFLAYNIIDHTDETFFQGIKRIPKAHYAVYDLEKKKLDVSRYWSIKSGDEEEDPSRIKELFVDSVKLRLRSDVPVGSCLSGGVDSSSIVCCMKELLNEENNVETFSAVYPGKQIDESQYIDEVVEKCAVKKNTTEPDAESLLKDLRDIIIHQEEPFARSSTYAQYRVMKLAHEKGMKVLLDGQGGDELYAGYTYFYSYYFKELLKRGRVKKLLTELLAYWREQGSLYELGVTAYLMLPTIFKEAVMKKMSKCISREFYDRHRKKSRFLEEVIDSGDLTEALLTHMEYKMEHLLRFEDKNSMAFSVETRLPFLDYRFVEYAFSLESDAKIRDGYTKAALRESMKNTLPEKIFNRRDKIGFATPEEGWLKNKQVSEYLRSMVCGGGFKTEGYYDMGKLKKTVEKHLKGEVNASRTLWKVLFLEEWYRAYITGE